MKLQQLNLLIDSGIPIVCVTTPIRERINVIKWIYQECATIREFPLYLWNVGWGCFKEVKSDNGKIHFSNYELSNLLDAHSDSVFAALDFLLIHDESGIFILENFSIFN
ncbi:MAG: hypothetical protein HC908_08075 [Calothrix sp. SM1_7_51]|nr:hypothetical protein [Calothrix sp. SM1_7_51]